MGKKEIYSLINFTAAEINDFYDEHELELLLWVEPDITEVDIMLECLEEYFVFFEFYEKAAIVRDEIIRRIKRNDERLVL